jgi:hypothetical protein
MKKLLACVVGVLVLSRAASAMLIGADQLLGIVVPGTPADPEYEMIMVNGLLEGWGSVLGYNDGAASGTAMGDNPSDPQTESYTLKYSATTDLPVPGLASLATMPAMRVVTNDPEIDLGTSSYDWVVAKWGQDSAVYFIRGLSGTLELTREGTGWAPQAHGLSHYTLFNESLRVPDGGTTAAVLGFALIALEGLRRKLA